MLIEAGDEARAELERPHVDRNRRHDLEETVCCGDQATRDFINAKTDLGGPPTAAEVAAETGLTVDVAHMQRFGQEVRSLSEAITADSERRLEDVLADRSALDPSLEATRSDGGENFDRVLSLLDAGERDVLRLRFGLTGDEPRVAAEVAAALGLTLEAARRLQARALAKLRHPSAGQDVTDLLAS